MTVSILSVEEMMMMTRRRAILHGAVICWALSIVLVTFSGEDLKVRFSDLKPHEGVYYHKGKPFTGTAEYFYGGLLLELRPFISGHMTGVKSVFFGGRKLRGLYSVKNGLLHGPLIRFFKDDGLIAEFGRYSDGKRVGWHFKYDQETGLVKEKAHFDDGLESGVVMTFYKDGSIKTMQEYIRGKRNGRFVTYSPDGEPIREDLMKDDVVQKRYLYLKGKKVLQIDAMGTKSGWNSG